MASRNSSSGGGASRSRPTAPCGSGSRSSRAHSGGSGSRFGIIFDITGSLTSVQPVGHQNSHGSSFPRSRSHSASFSRNTSPCGDRTCIRHLRHPSGSSGKCLPRRSASIIRCTPASFNQQCVLLQCSVNGLNARRYAPVVKYRKTNIITARPTSSPTRTCGKAACRSNRRRCPTSRRCGVRKDSHSARRARARPALRGGAHGRLFRRAGWLVRVPQGR